MHLIKLFLYVFFLFHFIFSQIQLGSDIVGSAESDYLGSSVSLSSDGFRLVVGASGSDGPFSESPGYVRIFEYTGTSWSQIGLDIEGELEGEAFGSSVSMNSDGTIIAVGATGSNGPFGESPGLVRVFEFDGSSWNQIGLDIIGEYEEDESGCAVALNSEGTRVAIGAIGNADNGSFSGHVRVYEFNGTSWAQIGQDIDGESQGDTSGHSVSLSTDGNIVAIGATQNDGNGGAAGHVRVYEFDGNIWSQLGEDIDGEAAFDFIGSSVSLANNGLTLAAGGNATWNPPQPGVVRVYEYDGSSWNKLGLDIVGEADRDYSGCSVSLTDAGTRVAIGAQRNDGGGLDAGHVRIYDYLDGNWTQFFEDMNGDSDGDLFGSSVSISSDGLVIVSGAPQNDFGGIDAGHVKIYSLIDTFQPQTKEELQTAVDLWVNDNASALDTYGEINTWNVSLITDMSEIFRDKNMFNDAIGDWNVSNVTNMAYMFHGASSFNQNLPSWDVSSVTTMNNVFSNADSFNGDISTWDVSNVTTMSHMFIAAVSFNQNISLWNVSNVTSMQAMFVSANAFAQDISTWDVSNVISMNYMFEGNSGFNQDISTWDVSNVSGMHKMFLGASSFNQNIGSWNTQNVTDMGYMFLNALNFNQNLSNWNVSSVTNMSGMFRNATSFNGDISTWDVSNVTNMSSMFAECHEFNQDLSSWDVSNVIYMDKMFERAYVFNSDVSNWNVSSVINMSHLFYECTNFVGNLSVWDVSNVIDMSRMFDGASNFNQDVSMWDVSNVINMDGMFWNAPSFNINISEWNVSNVTNLNRMFYGASNFNQNLSSWNVSNVITMSQTFQDATSFNGDISTWNVSNVVNMGATFMSATSFDSDLSSWNVASVTTFENTFNNTGITYFNRCAIHESWSDQNDNWAYDWSEYCTFFPQSKNELETAIDLWVDDNTAALETYGGINTWNVSLINDMSMVFINKDSFNDDIGSWDVSNVTNMMGMFYGASSFNQDLFNWDVSNVTDISRMFEEAENFNGDISSWDVSNVQNMEMTFRMATAFNQDLSSWNVSNVSNMKLTFEDASNFEGDLSAWDVSNVSDMYGMFLRANNFNSDISAWDVSNTTNMSHMFLGCSNFAAGLSEWTVSNVSDMSQMFDDATNFNGDISGWDVSNVIEMEEMFLDAQSFNQNISGWNVSLVVNMDNMFLNTNSLSGSNQCLIDESFSANEAWPYNWFGSCQPELTEMPDVIISQDQVLQLILLDFAIFPTQSIEGYSFSSFTDDSANVMVEVEDYILVIQPANEWVGSAHVTISVHNDSSDLADTTHFVLEVEETDLSTVENMVPDFFALHQNYPNPFNPTTQIKYDLPDDQFVSIAIYDVMGHNIRTLMNVKQTAGYHSIHWDAKNDIGEDVAAGMYIYIIQAGEFRATKKMVLLK